MSRIGGELRSILGYTGLFSLCGIACLLVAYLGPQYGVGPAYQIVMIVLIVLTLPFVMLVDAARRRRERRRQEAAEGGEGAAGEDGGGRRRQGRRSRGAEREAGAPAGPYEDLTRGAEEVVQWLRDSKLGAAADGAEADDVVYALPWFVVAGPHASGKTSLALSTGLNYETLPSQPRLVRPTRGCDWWVTDAAVFLDTAGRYQIEDTSGDEWAALAETLKRYRGRRPLDGLVVAVSAAWAAVAAEAEIEQRAKTLRARIDVMMKRTGVRFPVYVVWTHADAFRGFGQFFGRMSRDERGAEVWGTTFPLEQALEGSTTALLDVEFDALLDALARRRLARLAAPDPPADQLAVFNFPARFAEARESLILFTSTLFLPSPYTDLPLLRGFYFTSNVAGARAAKSAAAAAEGDEARPDISTREIGEGFFVERLFKDVLLRDRDLAAALQPPPSRPRRLRIALLAAAALLAAGLMAAFVASYAGNRRLIAEAGGHAARVEENARRRAARAPAAQDEQETQLEIEALERLRGSVAALDEHEREGPPPGLSFLLYAGDEISPQARSVYFEEITRRYFRPTLAALEKDLRAFAAGTPAAAVQPAAPGETPSEEDVLGRHYDLLKAYLMLTSEPTRVEPTFLAAQLDEHWRAASPGADALDRQQLDFYARQADRADAPRARADARLVAAARERLAAYPAANRFYKRVTTEINARTQPVTLASVLGGRGGGVLSGSYTVPGSYTVVGFREHVSPAFASASDEISKDDWVMGAANAGGGGADVSKLWGLYFRDYTNHWSRFLRETRVADFRTQDDAVRALRALTATDSPLELVVESVARNTDLSAAPQTSGFFDRLRGLFRRSRAHDTGGNSEVEREFRPAIEFAATAKSKDAVAVSQYRAALREVLDPLETSSPDQLTQTARELMSGSKDEINLRRSEATVERLLAGFTTAASRDAAALLKQPLRNLRGLLYGGSHAEIVREWRDQLYPVAKRLEDGYPFTDSGAAPTDLLTSYLNPVDGQLTVFFNTRLASSFDDVEGRWKMKEGGGFQFTKEFEDYLNNARRLRDALFPAGNKREPEFNYDVTLQPVPNADVMLEIDGSRVDSRGSSPASAKFFFPARKGGSSGARVAVTGQSPDKTFPGEWGLYNLLQAGGAGSPSADNSYSITLGVGSATVRAKLRPSSAVSPFDRKLFTSLRAPRDIAAAAARGEP